MHQTEHIKMDRDLNGFQWHEELSSRENLTKILGTLLRLHDQYGNPLLREVTFQLARRYEEQDQKVREFKEQRDVAIAESERLLKELDIAYSKMVTAKADLNTLRAQTGLDSKPSGCCGGGCTPKE